MGQTETKFGKVVVQVETPILAPGETLKGTLNVYLTGFFPGNTLKLKVFGQVKVKWGDNVMVTKGGTRIYSRDRVMHWSNREIFAYSFPISISKTAQTAAGQYRIPFSFTLPEDIPGSFKRDHFDTHVKIFYKVLLEFGSHDPKVSSLSDEIEFAVKGSKILEEVLASQSTKEVKTGFFFKRGASSLSLNVKSNTVKPGQNLTFTYSVDNSACSRNLSAINVRIKKILRLRSKRGDNQWTRTIKEDVLPGVSAHMKAENATGSILVEIPETEPGVVTEILTCTYFLELTAKVDGRFVLSNYPKVEIPLNVVSEEHAIENPEIEVPDFWKPETLEMVSFQGDNQYVYHQLTDEEAERDAHP